MGFGRTGGFGFGESDRLDGVERPDDAKAVMSREARGVDKDAREVPMLEFGIWTAESPEYGGTPFALLVLDV